MISYYRSQKRKNRHTRSITRSTTTSTPTSAEAAFVIGFWSQKSGTADIQRHTSRCPMTRGGTAYHHEHRLKIKKREYEHTSSDRRQAQVRVDGRTDVDEVPTKLRLTRLDDIHSRPAECARRRGGGRKEKRGDESGELHLRPSVYKQRTERRLKRMWVRRTSGRRGSRQRTGTGTSESREQLQLDSPHVRSVLCACGSGHAQAASPRPAVQPGHPRRTGRRHGTTECPPSSPCALSRF